MKQVIIIAKTSYDKFQDMTSHRIVKGSHLYDFFYSILSIEAVIEFLDNKGIIDNFLATYGLVHIDITSTKIAIERRLVQMESSIGAVKEEMLADNEFLQRLNYKSKTIRGVGTVYQFPTYAYLGGDSENLQFGYTYKNRNQLLEAIIKDVNWFPQKEGDEFYLYAHDKEVSYCKGGYNLDGEIQRIYTINGSEKFIFTKAFQFHHLGSSPVYCHMIKDDFSKFLSSFN